MLNYALIAAEEAKGNNLAWAVDIFTFIGI